MSVYVDNARNQLGRMRMSHMIADTCIELVQMIDALDMREVWVQPDRHGRCSHVDVCQQKRSRAIALGAVPVSTRELARLSRQPLMMRGGKR